MVDALDIDDIEDDSLVVVANKLTLKVRDKILDHNFHHMAESEAVVHVVLLGYPFV